MGYDQRLRAQQKQFQKRYDEVVIKNEQVINALRLMGIVNAGYEVTLELAVALLAQGKHDEAAQICTESLATWQKFLSGHDTEVKEAMQ